MSRTTTQFADAGERISELQHQILSTVYEPTAEKKLRPFAAREAARWLGVSPVRLRSVANEMGVATRRGGVMTLTIDQIGRVRDQLREKSPSNPRYQTGRRPGERCQVVATSIFKGGTGKTTIGVHFAQYLALRGHRVLLVDLDPQASATTLFGLDPSRDVEDDATFYGFVTGERPFERLPIATYWANLDLVPANLALALTDFEIAGRAKLEPERPIHDYLRQGLDAVREAYDVVVLDCRPDLGMSTLNALLAASGVFVPVTMSQLDIASLGEYFRFSSFLLEQLESIGVDPDALRHDFFKIVVNRYDAAQVAQAQCYHWLRAHMPGEVVATPMLQTAALGHAGAQWQTLYEYEPDEGRRRAYNRALEALDALCFDLEAVLWQAWGRERLPFGDRQAQTSSSEENATHDAA